MPISPRGATSVSRVLADRPSVSLICNFTNLHFGWNGPSATVNLRRTSNRTPHAFPSRSRKHSGICNSVMPGNRQGHSGLPAHPAQKLSAPHRQCGQPRNMGWEIPPLPFLSKPGQHHGDWSKASYRIHRSFFSARQLWGPTPLGSAQGTEDTARRWRAEVRRLTRRRLR